MVAPIIFLGIYDMTQTRSTIPRIFPVVGRLRFLFEAVRPEMQQYFVESDINGIPLPDFITIDGGEGGTGAAPVELTNSVGTPLRDALWFVHNALHGIGVRDQVKLIASGKHFSAFHILRSLALGADTINTARGMMFALGCIQSRQCNANTCPTGVATQDPRRYKHLHIEDKARRVAHYHRSTVHALLELVATTGLDTPSQVEPKHLLHRVNGPDIRSYAELYPGIIEGCLIHPEAAPADWQRDWRKASPTSWH